MGDAPIGRAAYRPATVREDWQAWLPEEKDSLFQAMLDEMEVSYVILSVTLNDAFSFCGQGRLHLAREQAGIFSGLFDRVASRLRGVLRTLDEHGRHFGTNTTVAPLRVDLFRNEQSQTVARANHLLTIVSLRRPGRFFRKLSALDELIAKLQKQMRAITAEILEGATLCLPQKWTHLEVLHHDLNTCFCETTIVLKSFFCAMPDAELLPFRKRLLSLVPASTAVHPGCPDSLLPEGAPPCQPQPEAGNAQAAVTGAPDETRRRQRQLHS